MIDLHCHSHISDCPKSQIEVILQAKANGVKHLAITDHDTGKGNQKALEIGKQAGVNIITGIEVSAYDFKRGKKAHILGYHIQADHPVLETLCRLIQERRNRNSQMVVKQLNKSGFNITWEEVLSYTYYNGTGVFKQHIMHALMDKGYCDSLDGTLYKKLFSPIEGQEEPAIRQMQMNYVDAKTAIRAIRMAGGVPVLAHPGVYGNFEAIPEWAALGLRGIEKYHPEHTEKDLIQADFYADKFKLIKTGGSDYHHIYASSKHRIGINGDIIEPSVIDKLKEEVYETRRALAL